MFYYSTLPRVELAKSMSAQTRAAGCPAAIDLNWFAQTRWGSKLIQFSTLIRHAFSVDRKYFALFLLPRFVIAGHIYRRDTEEEPRMHESLTRYVNAGHHQRERRGEEEEKERERPS